MVYYYIPLHLLEIKTFFQPFPSQKDQGGGGVENVAFDTLYIHIRCIT
jgi:hypothetical protein